MLGHSFYDITLHLSPSTGELRAHVRLDYRATTESSELSFLLHQSLRPSAVTGDGVTDFTWVEGKPAFQFIGPDGATLTVRFDQPLVAGETRRLEFIYAGCPGIVREWQVNRLTPEWVELGLYTPWFPLRPDEKFAYRVDLTVDDGYDAIGLGATERRGDHWVVSSDEPMMDITIIAAPRLLRVERTTGAGAVAAHFTNSDDLGLATRLADDGNWAVDFFNRWLGTAGVAARQASIVIAPRTVGGAYARPGMVVMSRPDEGEEPSQLGLFRWLAHEFAHLWWLMAPTSSWEDWLNEAFAEFSALTAIRSKYGHEVYAERLAVMRSKSLNLPAVVGLPRSHEQAHAVLYIKGSVILTDLEQVIGSERMTDFLRKLLEQRATSTEQLLAVLAEVAGDEAAGMLDERLRS